MHRLGNKAAHGKRALGHARFERKRLHGGAAARAKDVGNGVAHAAAAAGRQHALLRAARQHVAARKVHIVRNHSVRLQHVLRTRQPSRARAVAHTPPYQQFVVLALQRAAKFVQADRQRVKQIAQLHSGAARARRRLAAHQLARRIELELRQALRST